MVVRNTGGLYTGGLKDSSEDRFDCIMQNADEQVDACKNND